MGVVVGVITLAVRSDLVTGDMSGAVTSVDVRGAVSKHFKYLVRLARYCFQPTSKTVDTPKRIDIFVGVDMLYSLQPSNESSSRIFLLIFSEHLELNCFR